MVDYLSGGSEETDRFHRLAKRVKLVPKITVSPFVEETRIEYYIDERGCRQSRTTRRMVRRP